MPGPSASRRPPFPHALGAASCGLVLLALGAVSARADGPSLNISPGLWEISVTTNMAGAMPIPDDALAKMTPEQRAKVEAMMNAMKAHGMHNKFRECLTAEQIRNGLKLRDKSEPDCKRTVTSSTGTSLDVHEVCGGAHPRTATAHFETPDPGTLHGHVTMEVTRGMHTTTATSEMNGQRLGSDCGGLKPGQVQHE